MCLDGSSKVYMATLNRVHASTSHNCRRALAELIHCVCCRHAHVQNHMIYYDVKLTHAAQPRNLADLSDLGGVQHETIAHG